MARHCIHCFISGKVQGVWFRANTKQQAEHLGITGWVKNISGGRVEVYACGDESQLQYFQTWLHQGPKHAQVSDVSLESKDWEDIKNFTIK